ncbi:hypothetical protein X474_01950 [Dethiosulfatarculus sandiegensis]|uniref:Uncharacterized protein n=1 Tax=Dethiosulfatarculus sandiegensis TaxID=1429043 RepID=A0A0D2HZH6_9BACT|nr:hypothetical protein X474_01950 [Dethiosulfatarculus sandiegensis]
MSRNTPQTNKPAKDRLNTFFICPDRACRYSVSAYLYLLLIINVLNKEIQGHSSITIKPGAP